MASSRTNKLSKLFNDVVTGKAPISPANSKLFLEALRSNPQPTASLHMIDSSPKGKNALQNAVWFTLTVPFINDHVVPVLQYLQEDPNLPQVDSGQLLQRIVLCMVDPPIFWTPFCMAFLQDTLSPAGQEAFAWLLLQLVNLPPDASTTYRNHADFATIQTRLLDSSNRALRTIGQQIKHAVEAFRNVSSEALPTGCNGSVPGGRHDNDFVDFRSISIVPTPDEVVSTLPVFLRPSSVLREPGNEDSRVAIHLDNQFRLLREDMLYELREELQVAFGKSKRRGRSTRVTGLKATGLYFQEAPRFQNGKPRWSKCGLELECAEDLPIFKGIDPERRGSYIRDDKVAKDFLKHQSLACLIDGDEVIAFVTVYRDTNLLAKKPPILVAQLESKEGLKNTLRRIKEATNLTLLQLNTALWSYEFVLKALQEATSLPLSDELLLWDPDTLAPPTEIEESKQARAVVNALRRNPACDLKPLLQTKDTISLDSSQSRSLLAGLTQRVSLIQGPPGKYPFSGPFHTVLKHVPY